MNMLIKNTPLIKQQVIAKNYKHLAALIKKEVGLYGASCNLNHINVSQITEMSYLFCNEDFNGDISMWDVSNVVNMSHMFHQSKFNGDISKWDTSSVVDMESMFAKSNFNQDLFAWNVSKVKNMTLMFYKSKFNQNISEWDVSSVTTMEFLFLDSNFSQDLTNWRPISLKSHDSAFKNSPLIQKNILPYWSETNIDFLPQAITAHLLNHQLTENLRPSKTTNTLPTKHVVKL